MVLNSSVGVAFARLLRYVDALVFVSKRQRQLFLEHLKHVTGNIPKSFVIYNPVPEVGYSAPMSVDVGYFGGASPLKGYHVLFRAWSRVYRRYKGVKLYTTKMGVLAGSKALEKAGIIAYGRLSLDRLEDIWRSVSTVVVPSIWEEPAPYVVVEALLRGRLLIASRVGGIPEIAEGAPGVRFVEPGDVDGLAGALNWALSMDRSETIELGLRNREYALKKFDSERSARELIRVFEQIL